MSPFREHLKHWCGLCRGQETQSLCILFTQKHVPCAGSRPNSTEVFLFMWDAGPQTEELLGEGLFLFIAQRGEPTGSRLRKVLTQGRLSLLITPRVTSRMLLEQELGAGCDAECEPGTRSSLSAASHDCKNFILFNNSNNSTKIIQSTFNTQGWRGQEERRPVWPGSITSRLQQRQPSWARGHGGGGPIVKNKCGSVKKKKSPPP